MSVDFDYKLIRSDRKSMAVQVSGGEVVVRAPRHVRESEIERFLLKHSDWVKKKLEVARKAAKELKADEVISAEELQALAKRAAEVIPKRVEYYAKLVGVTYGRITIRAQKTRWGSCTAKGNLNFNCLLMLTPLEVLDSVVVHELCHRKQMNHSDKFYKEVIKVFPEYHKCRAWLSEHGDSLLVKAGKR